MQSKANYKKLCLNAIASAITALASAALATAASVSLATTILAAIVSTTMELAGRWVEYFDFHRIKRKRVVENLARLEPAR